MPSAINKYAYYVHYFAANFERQQKLPSETALSNYAIQRVRSLSGNLKSGISKEVKQEYANTISALYGRGITDTQLTNIDVQKAQAALEGILLEQIKEFTTADKIQWKTGRVLNGQPQGDLIKQGAGIKQTQYLTEQQLENLQILIDDLQHQVMLLGEKAKQSKYQKLTDQLKQIQTMISNIKKQTDSKMRTLKGWNPGLFGAKTNSILRYNLGKENRQLLNDLNKQLKECEIKNIVIQRAQGTLGEDIAALAADVVSGVGLSKLYETINQAVVGSNATRLEFNIKGMPANVYAKTFLGKTAFTKNDILYSTNVSQGKVDAIINLPITKTRTGFKKVNVSMKSVDLAKDIHLVSGTNLWYLIQDEGVAHFLRPYLNIIADHRLNRNIGIYPSNRQREISAIENINALKNDAFLATQILTAYKALSGNTFGRSAAQLFVVNDVSSQQVYVLEINDIIRAILKNVELNKSAINDYFSFEGLDDLTLTNDWQEEGLHVRMANLIRDAHAKKLFVSLKNQAFKGKFAKEAIIS